MASPHILIDIPSGYHIVCTNGTPIVDTLDHLPPLPIFVDYRLETKLVSGKWQREIICAKDELGIYHALRLPDRVRRVELRLPPSTLHKLVMLMDKSFPRLEYLALEVVDYETTALPLPSTFLAPNLRCLILGGISLPKRLRLLTSTTSLVKLTLREIPASGYFRPRLLVARLQSLPLLEELGIAFSIPLPRLSAERELLGEQGTPVTLSKLKFFWFWGVCAYLDRLVSQMRAPLLERLSIRLFNQLVFTLPHLADFVHITKIKLSIVRVFFDRSGVTVNQDPKVVARCFDLDVSCGPLDWQVGCTAQICSVLRPMLSGAEELTLVFHGKEVFSELQVDGTTWCELLRSFIGVKRVYIHNGMVEELSRALEEVDNIGSDPEFLPSLEYLILWKTGTHADNLFGSFIRARRLVGRPISLF